MDAWISGLLAGLIATVVMTPVMMMGMSGPPGPSRLFAKITGGDANSQGLKMAGMMGHMVYGGVAGLVFGVLAVDAFGWTSGLIGWGLLFGVVLMAVMMMVWAPVIGMMAEMKTMEQSARMKMAVFAMGAHLVYGAVLGWLTQVFL